MEETRFSSKGLVLKYRNLKCIHMPGKCVIWVVNFLSWRECNFLDNLGAFIYYVRTYQN